MNGNFGSAPVYEPNSLGGPTEDPSKKLANFNVSGAVGRHYHQHPNTNYEQPAVLFRKVMSETDRAHLIENIVGAMTGIKKAVSFSNSNVV